MKYIYVFLLCLSFVSCTKKEPRTKACANFTIDSNFVTVDPRKARDISTVNLIRNVYEGLCAYDENDNVVHALAKEILVSADRTEYTIKLYPAKWSDGKELTAYDFEYSWKTALTPEQRAVNACQLFVIKNGKAIYDGKLPVDMLGVHVIDKETLKVTLEQPINYFIELLATHPFFPIAKHVFEKIKENSQINPLEIPTNGPFRVTQWQQNCTFSIEKNSHYRKKNVPLLNKITFSVFDPSTALQMFENGALDWAGSPISVLSTPSIPTLRKKNLVHSVPGYATGLLRVNVSSRFLSHKKLRKALYLACDREELVEVLQANFTPAYAFIPANIDGGRQFFAKQDVTLAQKYFREACDDLKTTNPSLSIIYINTERNQLIVQTLQQNFKKTLHCNITIQPLEAKTFCERLKTKEYDMAIGCMLCDMCNEGIFLKVFQYKDSGTNHTTWENGTFGKLIDEGLCEENPAKQQEKFRSAEAILMDELPIIPLYFLTYNYLKNPRLHGVTLHRSGVLDLSKAYID